ncbi:hypothetical protein A2631_05180 [Candidatus Daviesbacteria bacterium RIFCSPHIGHO2_01_FULL_44_29]|uniref:R3H domain-containing protein n=1 Tax=Candidatus Daviesbacteria bacterium RIFCSPHIGHO2_02_FULL_43_12 TaxID=1797776 RepID=A0A1F5KGR0_9BACT|nr:MAG: hypothetical protein A2631_05180 [Candidatus Daviesbacteria bacterium RIFCSPHIGHO2_01_FULL_44_29]OGE40112.1 MAG: hypothetical protein A3D25_04900 [Candidatus Daviesbacteria bacterium RIFCSPHIGHO2_02_FULL_43_12]OGE41061.1 MAG: hypothetical protein A3E86_05005 [Candidatus Daviesbacteria bacterium RIFCSPHIGHO2_12_FULL_47_45]OGE70206.1 MAG: hypothetical protein A3B55_00660 [Candidatus Daviesbacteria bacterium RIFCSPLOWO2_01_FULL_43_15]
MPLETRVSEILENILGLLSLEGSFEVEETDQGVMVSIDTEDAGRLIGRQGETLTALQLLVNQILSRQLEKDEKPTVFKRVIVDVADWKKQREGDLVTQAKNAAEQVKLEGKELALEPMPSWQRRVMHMAIEGLEGVYSESLGEGEDRHLVIKPGHSPASEEPSVKESPKEE